LGGRQKGRKMRERKKEKKRSKKKEKRKRNAEKKEEEEEKSERKEENGLIGVGNSRGGGARGHRLPPAGGGLRRMVMRWKIPYAQREFAYLASFPMLFLMGGGKPLFRYLSHGGAVGEENANLL